MFNQNHHQDELAENGFAILKDIYVADEVKKITNIISSSDFSTSNFRKTEGLFAIRQLFK